MFCLWGFKDKKNVEKAKSDQCGIGHETMQRNEAYAAGVGDRGCARSATQADVWHARSTMVLAPLHALPIRNATMRAIRY